MIVGTVHVDFLMAVRPGTQGRFAAEDRHSRSSALISGRVGIQRITGGGSIDLGDPTTS